MEEKITSAAFIKKLRGIASPAEVEKVARFFKSDQGDLARDNKILGVSIGKVFPIAKACAAMPLAEIEKLLESPYYEARMGAVAIMDFQARAKSATPAHRKALYELYLRRHDRINNWDLVDRAAPHVVGGYLADKPRDVLYRLAKSRNPWERRTAIVSTWYFIRSGDVAETFKIAALLVEDEHDLIQKAVGSWLREAGKRDRAGLLAFLDEHAPRMDRTALRYAVERFGDKLRKRYLAVKPAG